MRAGQLSNPAFVKLLRPFVVTSWHGAGEKEMPADVKDVWTRAGLVKRSNVFMFALDAKGQLAHGFSAVRGGPRGKPGVSTPQQEIAKAIGKLKLPDDAAKAPQRPIELPDLPATKGESPAGVRLFVRPNSRPGGKRVVVELVAMTTDEWKPLSFSTAAREVKAEALRRWLVQMYPPAIRTVDQKKPFKKITGTLRLEPAGSDAQGRYALLRGDVHLAKGDETESAFQGNVHVVITYPRDATHVRSLRGVVEGDYLYRIRGRTQKLPLIAAIESRPGPQPDPAR